MRPTATPFSPVRAPQLNITATPPTPRIAALNLMSPTASASRGTPSRASATTSAFSFAIRQDGRVGVEGPYYEPLRLCCKHTAHGEYDYGTKEWCFDPAHYHRVVQNLREMLVTQPCPKVAANAINELPRWIVDLLEGRKLLECAPKGKRRHALVDVEPLPESDVEHALRALKAGPVWPRLRPFQKEGVTEAVRRRGKILIGDDMGAARSQVSLRLARPRKDAASARHLQGVRSGMAGAGSVPWIPAHVLGV